jgi:hypothetical protein
MGEVIASMIWDTALQQSFFFFSQVGVHSKTMIKKAYHVKYKNKNIAIIIKYYCNPTCCAFL